MVVGVSGGAMIGADDAGFVGKTMFVQLVLTIKVK